MELGQALSKLLTVGAPVELAAELKLAGRV